MSTEYIKYLETPLTIRDFTYKDMLDVPHNERHELFNNLDTTSEIEEEVLTEYRKFLKGFRSVSTIISYKNYMPVGIMHFSISDSPIILELNGDKDAYIDQYRIKGADPKDTFTALTLLKYWMLQNDILNSMYTIVITTYRDGKEYPHPNCKRVGNTFTHYQRVLSNINNYVIKICWINKHILPPIDLILNSWREITNNTPFHFID